MFVFRSLSSCHNVQCLKDKLDFLVVSSLSSFANMMTMKLCKGSWAPQILYPEGGSSSSVVDMSDADVLVELKQLAGAPQDDSQERDIVEDEFPGIARALSDPYTQS